jgi:stage II sporulation protein AA (anti-sigma F factor antagonist)
MWVFDEGHERGIMELILAVKPRGESRVTVKVEEKDGVLVAWLSGELDHHAADEVRRQLDTAMYNRPARKVVLDMSRMTFMDSAGIGVVLGRYRKVKEAGGRLAVRGPGVRVDKILSLAGVYSIVEKE